MIEYPPSQFCLECSIRIKWQCQTEISSKFEFIVKTFISVVVRKFWLIKIISKLGKLETHFYSFALFDWLKRMKSMRHANPYSADSLYELKPNNIKSDFYRLGWLLVLFFSLFCLRTDFFDIAFAFGWSHVFFFSYEWRRKKKWRQQSAIKSTEMKGKKNICNEQSLNDDHFCRTTSTPMKWISPFLLMWTEA